MMLNFSDKTKCSLILSPLFMSVSLLISGISRSDARELPKNREITWKLIRSYQKIILPGMEVPQFPEYYTWRITGKIGNQLVYENKIPVYHWNEFRQEFTNVGDIAEGTEIKLDSFLPSRGRIYYAVPVQSVILSPNIVQSAVEKSLFVNGYSITRDDKDSFQPPKSFRLVDFDRIAKQPEASSPQR